MRLLVTGVPCTGKSTFSRWLANEHGFVVCHSDHDPNFIQDAATAASTGKKVVLDWGIPAGALDFAKRFIDEHGFDCWWFDGDIETAKQVFISRPGHHASLADWDIYINGLRTHATQYASLYDDRLIRRLEPGPTWAPSNEEILRLIRDYQR